MSKSATPLATPDSGHVRSHGRMIFSRAGLGDETEITAIFDGHRVLTDT